MCTTDAQILWSHTILEAFGNDKGLLAGIKIKNLKTDAVTDLEVCSLCVTCMPHTARAAARVIFTTICCACCPQPCRLTADPQGLPWVIGAPHPSPHFNLGRFPALLSNLLSNLLATAGQDGMGSSGLLQAQKSSVRLCAGVGPLLCHWSRACVQVPGWAAEDGC